MLRPLMRTLTSRSRLAALGVALTWAAACSEPTRPAIDPSIEMQRFGLNSLTTRMEDGGYLTIHAIPRDTSFRWHPGHLIAAEVEVRSGDRERIRLTKAWCPNRSPTPFTYNCFTITLSMQDGHHAFDLAPRLAEIDARFTVVSVSGRFAGLVLFEESELVRSANRVASWPGVDFAGVSPHICTGVIGDLSCFPDSHLARPVRVDHGAPIPGDGIVQVVPGDTVWVSYRQPDGQVLRDWWVAR
jgi:hypothetical protein